MTKFHNRRVAYDGHVFDSQAECARYQELCLLEKTGAIRGLVVHPKYELLPKEGALRAVHYIADFAYQEGGKAVVEDVKGVETAVFRLKANLFRRRYRDIELRVVKGE